MRLVWLALTLTSLAAAGPLVVFENDPTPDDGGYEGSRVSLGGDRTTGYRTLSPEQRDEIAVTGRNGTLPLTQDSPYGGRGNSLRIELRTGAVGWWRVALPIPRATLPERSILADGQLVLALRGGDGNHGLEVGLLDDASPRHTVRVPLARYGPLATSWTIYRVPLDDFLSLSPDLDLARLAAVELYSTRPGPLTYDLDHVRFEPRGTNDEEPAVAPPAPTQPAPAVTQEPIPAPQPTTPPAVTPQPPAPPTVAPSLPTRPGPRVPAMLSTGPASTVEGPQPAGGRNAAAAGLARPPHASIPLVLPTVVFRPRPEPTQPPAEPTQPTAEPAQPTAEPTQPTAEPTAAGAPRPDKPLGAAPESPPTELEEMETVADLYSPPAAPPATLPGSRLEASFATNRGERALDPDELTEYFQVTARGELPQMVVGEADAARAAVRLTAKQAGFAWWTARLPIAGAPVDLSPWLRNGRLELKAKGDVGGETLRVGLADAADHVTYVPLETIVELTGDWTTLRIPLRALRAAQPELDWAAISRIFLASANGRPMTVYLSDFRIVNPPVGR